MSKPKTGQPDDGDCDGDEDRILFVFNLGGNAASNPVTCRGCGTSRTGGFDDADEDQTHRALILRRTNVECARQKRVERVRSAGQRNHRPGRPL